MTADGLRPDGLPLVEVFKGLSHGANYLSPNTVTLYEAASEQGYYFGYDVDSRAYFEYPIEGPPASEPQIVRVLYTEDACELSARTVAPGTIEIRLHAFF